MRPETLMILGCLVKFIMKTIWLGILYSHLILFSALNRKLQILPFLNFTHLSIAMLLTAVTSITTGRLFQYIPNKRCGSSMTVISKRKYYFYFFKECFPTTVCTERARLLLYIRKTRILHFYRAGSVKTNVFSTYI